MKHLDKERHVVNIKTMLEGFGKKIKA
jgi:hypothetical protein